MKTFARIALFAFALLALTNCEEEEALNVTLKNYDVYTLDLNISGDEEGAIIQTQAKHFEKSELIRDASTNWSVTYHYKPLPNYTGSDFVEIKATPGMEGFKKTEVKTVRIQFTITD